MTHNTPQLCDLDAVLLRQLIDDREISIVALLESCISRIEAVNPIVNAVVTTCYERARHEARAAEAVLAAGTPVPALHGLPLLVKDLADTEGVKTTYGSLCYQTHVPTVDSASVSLLRKSGAIVLGKTNTPEFGAGANTSNKVFGATCNPFNPKLTSGGSSGGSAVALACGMAPLATGSDLGGSLRIPASFCSVVGMRPSPGRVPSNAHACGFSPLWTDGPMARTVADTALCLGSMSGYQPTDPLSHPIMAEPFNHIDRDVDLSNLRVGFSTDLGVAPIEAGIEAVFEQRKALLRKHFARSNDLSMDLSEAALVFRILRVESLYASYSVLAEQHADLLSDNVMSNIHEAGSLSLKDTAFANAQHTRLFREFQGLFNDHDVLICPATAVSPFPVEDNFPLSINGQPLDGYQAWYAITWALSLMGCPIVTVPCGSDHLGMPFGIQVIGARHEDASVLSVAQALENTLSQSGHGRLLPDLLSLPG